MIIDFTGSTNPPFDIFIPQNCNNPNANILGIVGPTYTSTRLCGCANPFLVYVVSNSLGESCANTIAIPNPVSTGIREILYENSVSFSPHPVSDVLSFDFKSIHNTNNKIEIANTLGQMVLTHALLGDEINNLNVQHLPNGIYFVKAYTDNKQIGYKKIGVQK